MTCNGQPLKEKGQSKFSVFGLFILTFNLPKKGKGVHGLFRETYLDGCLFFPRAYAQVLASHEWPCQPASGVLLPTVPLPRLALNGEGPMGEMERQTQKGVKEATMCCCAIALNMSATLLITYLPLFKPNLVKQNIPATSDKMLVAGVLFIQ